MVASMYPCAPPPPLRAALTAKRPSGSPFLPSVGFGGALVVPACALSLRHHHHQQARAGAETSHLALSSEIHSAPSLMPRLSFCLFSSSTTSNLGSPPPFVVTSTLSFLPFCFCFCFGFFRFVQARPCASPFGAKKERAALIAQRIDHDVNPPRHKQQPQGRSSNEQPISFSRAPSSTASPAPTPLGKSFLRPRPIRSSIGSLQSASSGRDFQRPIQATGAYPKHSPCPSLTLPALL
ncbi:hypothetical protein J3F83DRAFT_703127 [Trichoderma novae-zelandiae]